MTENQRLLAVLEQGHGEAQDALEAQKRAWKTEDEARDEHRAAVLEAHAQGARDRDQRRVELGGASLIEAEEARARAAAEARLRAADEAAAKLKIDAEAKAKAEAEVKAKSEADAKAAEAAKAAPKI